MVEPIDPFESGETDSVQGSLRPAGGEADEAPPDRDRWCGSCAVGRRRSGPSPASAGPSCRAQPRVSFGSGRQPLRIGRPRYMGVGRRCVDRLDAAHCEPCSPSCSRTGRTARSRTSENGRDIRRAGSNLPGVGASGKPGACVDAPCLASMIFEISAGSSIGRVSGLTMWPSMTPRAGMLFGRLGSHRFRELHALEPRV